MNCTHVVYSHRHFRVTCEAITIIKLCLFPLLLESTFGLNYDHINLYKVYKPYKLKLNFEYYKLYIEIFTQDS